MNGLRTHVAIDIPENKTQPEEIKNHAIGYGVSDVLNEVKKKRSIRRLLREAASHTGTHGVPNIIRTDDRIRQVFWVCVVCAGIVIMTWQVVSVVKKYFEYPTTTSVDYDHNTNLQFPAVTVCNLNPAMMNKINDHQGPINISQYLNSIWEEWEVAWETNFTETPAFRSWHDAQNHNDDHSYSYDYSDPNDYGEYEFYSGNESASFDYLEDFITLMSRIPVEHKRALGHGLQEMFVGCTWQGIECTVAQFYQFYNYLYGNCYTFNSGRKESILRTSKEGPIFSFQVELFINAAEYIPGIADGAGVRVVIHDQSVMPLPEEDGFNVKPGTKTSVEVTKRIIKRASPPHGDCKDYSKSEVRAVNAYLKDYTGIGFSSKTCFKTCLQQNMMKYCDCFDPKLPYNANAEAYKEVSASSFASVCSNDSDLSNSRINCLQDVSREYMNDNLGCSKFCKSPCIEETFQYVTSSATWPSIMSQDYIVSEAALRNEILFNILTHQDLMEADRTLWVKNNLVKLEVYYKHFNLEKITTAPAYDALSLFADFGGQCGLWLGLSIIALFEVLELAVDLIVTGVNKCKTNSKRKREVGWTQQ